jgi:hypothetical protein
VAVGRFQVENDPSDRGIALILPYAYGEDIFFANVDALLRHRQPRVREINHQPGRRIQALNLRDYGSAGLNLNRRRSLFLDDADAPDLPWRSEILASCLDRAQTKQYRAEKLDRGPMHIILAGSLKETYH